MSGKLNELLLTVQKPGRYVGGEWNSVKKEWTADKVKVLLAFPDTYEIGSSYLGTKILYGILNEREDCLCERVFAPWPDFEKVLRENKIDLFSLESRKPIREFDIIGFSLAYELSYTNVLNILDLGGIPVRSRDRNDEHPIIIAGGPSCYNPEPMADFIDAFLIGDGEEAILEIIEIYKKVGDPRPQSKGRGRRGPGARKKILKQLSKIKGAYVPSFYITEYNEDGTIKKFYPIEDGVPEVVNKRVVADLDRSFYPAKQIVPNIQIVHDRIALEIMRGCKHACSFCQASAIYRPVRERSKDTIMKLAKEAYAATGYDEISLLSLSSGDYKYIVDVIRELNDEFGEKRVSISVPSLRIEKAIDQLPSLLSKVRKSGLTFAPEAGSDSLRKRLHKDIDIEKLFASVRESYKLGWRRVKLYFMIGLPSESEEDVAAISDLVRKISDLKREIDSKPATVAVSINAFVPKPHTVFQREAMEDSASLENKRINLASSLKSRLIELSFHSFQMSRLEAVFSRGDRRVSNAIFEAWNAGARFDGWSEMLDFNIWKEAFVKAGIDQAFYIYRKRDPGEILPWSFIALDHP
jgi:radical SAM family uncharacterized protein